MEKIVYNFANRNDVVNDKMLEALSYIYSLSYPKPDKSYIDMIKEGAYMSPKEKERLSNSKYIWPCDFYYVPDKVQREVWNSYKESVDAVCHWQNDMESLIEFLYEKPGLKEVYEPDEFNEKPYRHSVNQQLIKDVIGEEAANKLREVLEDYKNTYRWGQSYENVFAWGYLRTPAFDKEKMVKAWKEVFNKDIELPDDKLWIDIWEAEDEE